MAKSFSLIIQKYYADKNSDIKFPLNDELTNNEKIQLISKIFYGNPLSFQDSVIRHNYHNFLFLHNGTTNNHVVEKFNILKSGYFNIFYMGDLQQLQLETFNKMQKVYRGMCKLAYLYKFKKAKIQVAHDLYMNDLDPNNRNVFTLFDENHKYLFTLTDLVNIFYTSLCNSPYFIPTPVSCKNPYTNIPFTKANLYNIYFFILFNKIKVPTIIQNYFLCNFNLRRFLNENKRIIHDHAIMRYVNNSPVSVLRSSILEMIFEHNKYKKRLKIHADFPPNKLLEIMRPYLLLYYKSKFSCRRSINKKYHKLLTMKMKEFIKFNPNFGRKNITSESQFMLIMPHTDAFIPLFNDKHIKFELPNPDKTNFYNSHLSIDTNINSSDDELYSDTDNEDW